MEKKDSHIDELKILIANGNLEAFKKLFQEYYAVLVGFAQTYLKRIDMSEDVVSELFMYVWEKKDLLPEVTNFRSYLYKSVRNRTINVLQRDPSFDKMQFMDEDTVDSYAYDANPESQLIDNELSNSLKKIIEELPIRCRSCFYLVKEEGLSYKEAADILGISPRTVNAQLVIALKHIHQRLKKN